MKWTKLGRGAKALAVTLAVGLGVSACSRDYTVGYLYVTTSKSNPGLINAYSIDYQLGKLEALADSPIPSGGVNPYALVVSTDTNYTTNGAQFVYVINHDAPSSNVVEFAIGTDGKLYPENTYQVVQNTANTIIGTNPTAIAMDPSDTFLYITFTYQNGYSLSSPGPGGVAVFPINKDGSLGNPLVNTTVGTTAANPLPYFPVGNNPVGVAVSSPFCQAGTVPSGYAACTTSGGAAGYITLPNVYVIDQDSVSGTATGVVLAFQEGYNLASKMPTGYLTKVSGTTLTGFFAGSAPAAITADPNGKFLYVTDQATNQIYGYTVLASGALSAMSTPFATGLLPQGLTVDPRGDYLYVANYAGQSVTGYSINSSNGTLTAFSQSTTATGNGPNCVTIDPALGTYLYTSNNLSGSVSGMQLNPATGALTLIQGTPFGASALPTCAAAAASVAPTSTALVP
jgi:6-phosphogluconolactonase (cycloisomerase 2 family)